MCSMANEEHTIPMCGGVGRSSKKSKDKKVPQRGMGVAQLEKIILEEKHMNDVAVLKPNSTSFRPSSIPLPPPLPPNYHRPLIHTADDDAANHVFLPKPMHMSTGRGGHNWSRFRPGCENSFVSENQNQNQDQSRRLHLHHRRYASIMPTDLGGFSYESNWQPQPSSSSTQRSQLGCSSSMVNVSLGTASSVTSYQMEPPSIQIYGGNHHPPLWPEEDKIVGMKRPYPFSMEPIPSFNCTFPFSSTARSHESTSCSNGGTTSLEPPDHVSRENQPSLGTKTNQNTNKLTDDSNGLTKDFLTLAFPQEKEKLPLSVGEPTLQPLVQMRDPSGREWSNQKSLHDFFPVAKSPENINIEAGEHIDLNLKL